MDLALDKRSQLEMRLDEAPRGRHSLETTLGPQPASFWAFVS